jgi:mono/diheme cytochrome c family protein
MGITIGCLLIAKFAIIRFFQWFGKSLPAIGLGLLTCTIILATLSVPFAVRAHGFGRNLLNEENVARLKTVLGTIDWGESKIDPMALITPAAIERGQRVMATKCTGCHDLRTILLKPRSGDNWHEVVLRMAEKPSFGRPITPDEVPYVTAYLVALTPDIQESMQKKVAGERMREKQAAEVKAEMEPPPPPPPTQAGMTPTPTPTPTPVEPPKPRPAPPPMADASKYKAVFEEQCSQCHKLSQVAKHGLDDEKGWREIVQRMISENEADLSPTQVRQIVAYLAATRGKK